MNIDQARRRLCELYGIATEFHDIWGHHQAVSEDTQRALLAAMGICADDLESLGRAIGDRERSAWLRPLQPVLVHRTEGGAIRVPIALPSNCCELEYAWSMRLESGAISEDRFLPRDLPIASSTHLDHQEYRRHLFTLPMAIDIGYHQFRCGAATEEPGSHCSMHLIVAPATCYQSPALAEGGRLWGPTAQLYSLRSEHNWGLGDFSDLRTLTELVSEWKADILGVSPTHALFPHDPNHTSPYSPSSRLYLNVLYLDVEIMEDFSECEAMRSMVLAPAFQAQLRALRASELVDYEQVAASKLPVLRQLYRSFRERHLEPESARGTAFRVFQREQGASLRAHALFEALQAHLEKEDPSVWGWPAWPHAFHGPSAPAVESFADEHLTEVEFYEYLQWQADLQLSAVAKRCKELEMGVGLYQDLAVSVDPAGAEAWANQECYAASASIGAPPDEFSFEGQNWGLPPLIPERLRNQGYQPLITTLRRNMRHAGALRLDHVMGLMRLFWIPRGEPASAGTYVHYDLDEMLGILALESQRNRCLVVGEDLGTVPDEMRSAMSQRGIYSYRVLYFEKAENDDFIAPSEYPEHSLVTVSTHDLPTLGGFWEGVDLDQRTALGLLPNDGKRDGQVFARAQERARLLLALDRQELLPAGVSIDPASSPEMGADLCLAVHTYLARSNARLMTVQPEDLLGQRLQANMPGSAKAHPNWRRKLPLNLEAWRQDTTLQMLVAAIAAQRASTQDAEFDIEESAPISARIPDATYRLQLNAQFTFAQAADLVPYLHSLGFSHCYTSPYLRARPGSTHGYDVVHHDELNPEIGSAEDLERFVTALTDHQMGQILDVVPNHMGIMGSDNAWWLDVLENGPAAEHSYFFDIDWQPQKRELQGKVLVPVLGNHYGMCLEQGDLRLEFDVATGSFSVFYYEHQFPVAPDSYPQVLEHHLDKLHDRLGDDDPCLLEYQSLITAFKNLPESTTIDAEEKLVRARDKEIHKRHLGELCERSSDITAFIEEAVREFNGTAGQPASYDLLHDLMEAQCYRVAYWRVASDEINYRRFFDINDLAALRMEDAQVFEATHAKILSLIAEGKVDGLRIDHPDGLYDPEGYFRRLQVHAGRARQGIDPSQTLPDTIATSVYLVVEKILADYETLPESWPVHGTTGYEFGNLVNGLFVDASAQDEMTAIYESFSGAKLSFDELLYQNKKLIARYNLAGELNVLARELGRLAQADRHTRDFTLNSLRRALLETVACFPVYRTYVSEDTVSEQDVYYIDWAVAQAKQHSDATDLAAFDFVHDVLSTSIAEGKPQPYRDQVVRFALKFQQFTSPVMAKGLEDTSLYTYHRLDSLNDVGGDPRHFSVSPQAFHRANQQRARRWPHAMVGTSTHDSKRSEDARARINVLSEMPEEWQRQVRRWSRLNRTRKTEVEGRPAPSPNDEYLLYQTLIAVWPFEAPDESALQNLAERLENYMLKAIKEAKVNTSWIDPNEPYEAAMGQFVQRILSNPEKNAFLKDFQGFHGGIARMGAINSLAQLILKLTVPGVPDVYQGSELWAFTLVDPDNRSAVDYAQRRRLLDDLKRRFPKDHLDGRPAETRKLLDDLPSGEAKLFVSWAVLGLRRLRSELFRVGAYIPITVTGALAQQVCAFARRHEDQETIVIVPRLMARILGESTDFPLGEEVWLDTRIELPRGHCSHYRDVFTGQTFCAAGDEATFDLGTLLSHFPIALLEAVETAHS